MSFVNLAGSANTYVDVKLNIYIPPIFNPATLKERKRNA